MVFSLSFFDNDYDIVIDQCHQFYITQMLRLPLDNGLACRGKIDMEVYGYDLFKKKVYGYDVNYFLQ